MSTQINATQSSFANQATEFNATKQNKLQPVAEEALNNVTKEAELAETKVKQVKEQQEITNKYLNNEELLAEENEPLAIDEALELIADFMQLSSLSLIHI